MNETVLFIACRLNWNELGEYVIGKGVDVNVRNRMGNVAHKHCTQQIKNLVAQVQQNPIPPFRKGGSFQKQPQAMNIPQQPQQMGFQQQPQPMMMMMNQQKQQGSSNEMLLQKISELEKKILEGEMKRNDLEKRLMAVEAKLMSGQNVNVQQQPMMMMGRGMMGMQQQQQQQQPQQMMMGNNMMMGNQSGFRRQGY